ncbi:MAG: tlde1 domain-containing protein [Hyphomicrobium sp.]
MADIFSQIGDQIYEECIFELSPEQIEVQHALIAAYVAQGATSSLARQLAVKQIQPPKVSDKCESIRSQPQPEAEPAPWETTLNVPKKPKLKSPPKVASPPSMAETPAPATSLAALSSKKMLARWDCGPNVDYVTINLNGFKRKLTGGEICNPFEDVVHEVPEGLGSFRLGYAIDTGRLFVDTADPRYAGRTIAWALSGRDVCRNNPDPECLAARAIGSLPPGEYSFAAEQARRVSWGPKTKRNVAGIWLRKLWNKERFTAQQRKAMLARGNIAIHMRLKGEMSEACIGLEPKGWSYVATLIKEGRAVGVNAYLDEPFPQVAGKPPLIEGSSFSLTSLFK